MTPISRADLILHPQRLRIVLALTGHQRTPSDHKKILPDISQATLYRHITALVESEIITICEEKEVRGALERAYTADNNALSISAADLPKADRDDLSRYFNTFCASLTQQRWMVYSSSIPNSRHRRARTPASSISSKS